MEDNTGQLRLSFEGMQLGKHDSLNSSYCLNFTLLYRAECRKHIRLITFGILRTSSLISANDDV